MKKVYIKSEKFNTVEVYKLKEKNDVFKLKYYKHEGLQEYLVGRTVLKAVDTGNDLHVILEDSDFTLDYAQMEQLRIMLNVLAEKEDPTVKHICL